MMTTVTDYLALPFLNKSTFETAISHLTRHIDTFSPHLTYEVKHSTFDTSDVYLEITRLISVESPASKKESVEDESIIIDVDMEDEEEDVEILTRPSSPPSSPAKTHKVVYTITLSPIYSVPILHFSVIPLPPSTQVPIYSISEIYDILVPEDRRDEIRNLGVQGGISQGEHPYTHKVVWFVHPCRTAEVLREFGGDLKVESYLGVWIGVVGGVCGLVL